jgi:hypothetical protein
MLIKSDRRKIHITAVALNGCVPGFLVDHGAGLERFYPSGNVISAELEHTSTEEVIASTTIMIRELERLQALRKGIKDLTAAQLKKAVEAAQKEATSAAALTSGLPKDGQIGKDRKALVDATAKVIKLGEELQALIPAAAERPKADAPAERR